MFTVSISAQINRISTHLAGLAFLLAQLDEEDLEGVGLLQVEVACFRGASGADLPCTVQHKTLDDGREDIPDILDVVEAHLHEEHRGSPEVGIPAAADPEGSHVVVGSVVVVDSLSQV